MKHFFVAGLAAVFMAGALLSSAPPANAGCQYGIPGILGKCDGPIQPDGTWQRCVTYARLVPNGASSFLIPDKYCDVLGPDQSPSDQAFTDPPTHID